MNQQLIDFIQKAKSLSETDLEITSSLLSAGWKQQDISAAFEYVQKNSNVSQNFSTTDEPDPLKVTQPPEEKKAKPNKLTITLFTLGLLFVVTISGFFIYFKFFKKTPLGPNIKDSEEKPYQTSETIGQPNAIESTHSIIAFTTSKKDNPASAVVFYDRQQKEKLPLPQVIQEDNNFMFLLGPWSPSGQYLPILAFTGPATEESYVNLYFYDSQKLEAKKIYSSPRNEENFVWASTSFNFLSAWMDDTRLVVNNVRDPQKESATLTYVTTDGEIKTMQQSDELKRANDQLEHTVTTRPSIHTESITVGSVTLDFVLEGEVVGVVDGMLAVLEKPKSISVIVDDAGNAASPQDLEYFEEEMEKLEKQGLSEEELSKKTLELIEPKGKTILSLYNLKDGKVNREVNLTDGTWQVQSILVHPSEKFLIAHQTDKRHLPSKQRFVVITPSENPNTRTIFEEDLPKSSNPNYLSSLMFQENSFFLSSDGDWIIGMRGSNVDNPQNSTIYMKNIITQEESLICSNNCWDVRTYCPLCLQTVY